MGDRVRHKLTAARIKAARNGKLEDGGGLRLVKRGDRGKWVYRYSHLGKRREMGLGPWPTLSLADARKARDQWAAELAQGIDPVRARQAARDLERQRDQRTDPTFSEAVQIVFEARRARLRGGGERGRWLSPLTIHITPKIGRLRVSQITAADIKAALKPIWRTKHPTAVKALDRIRIVLREGAMMGLPCDPEAAQTARYQLGAVSHKVRPTPSTPWQEIPGVYARLGAGHVSHECLRFTMLTLVRIGAARAARSSEIDTDVWTVPAARIKGKEGQVEDFRVPLSPAAIGIAKACGEMHGDLLFPGTRGTAISDRALELAMDDIGEAGRPHGFRASFRTWAEETGVAWEVAETILGHAFKGKVERAYARSDLLEQRRAVLEDWARHVTGT